MSFEIKYFTKFNKGRTSPAMLEDILTVSSAGKCYQSGRITPITLIAQYTQT